MKTLHILNKSPKHPFPALQCARFYSERDSILLIEDAVYYTIPSTYQHFLSTPELKDRQITATIYALKEDIDARGIAMQTHSDIKVVTYEGFVELTASHDKSSSWY